MLGHHSSRYHVRWHVGGRPRTPAMSSRSAGTQTRAKKQARRSLVPRVQTQLASSGLSAKRLRDATRTPSEAIERRGTPTTRPPAKSTHRRGPNLPGGRPDASVDEACDAAAPLFGQISELLKVRQH